LGVKGWEVLQQTIDYIPKSHFIIADAKGEILAIPLICMHKQSFEELGCDSITIAPYMGRDSVTPFLAFSEKWAILLALTSNEGASDFQKLTLESGQPF
jgi:orotidine-5'-phosphate decarboxylase